MKIKLTLTSRSNPKKPVVAEFTSPLDTKAIIKTLELFGASGLLVHFNGFVTKLNLPDIGTRAWVGEDTPWRKEVYLKRVIAKAITHLAAQGLYK